MVGDKRGIVLLRLFSSSFFFFQIRERKRERKTGSKWSSLYILLLAVTPVVVFLPPYCTFCHCLMERHGERETVWICKKTHCSSYSLNFTVRPKDRREFYLETKSTNFSKIARWISYLRPRLFPFSAAATQIELSVNPTAQKKEADSFTKEKGTAENFPFFRTAFRSPKWDLFPSLFPFPAKYSSAGR